MATNDANSDPFKMIVFTVFVGFAILGVIMFALYQSKIGAGSIGPVKVWGSVPDDLFKQYLNELSFVDRDSEKIRYRYYPEETFDNQLIEALASGNGPDIVLLPNNQMMHHRDRLYAIPYKQYDVRQFKKTYIEAAEILMLPEGIIGMPAMIDPMVLYWNRTIMANKHYSMPPQQWNELFKMSRVITEKEDSGKIQLSTIALGESMNIPHAKEIYLAMLMQAGGMMFTLDASDNKDNSNSPGKLVATLANRNAQKFLPALDSLRFYTEFANPTKRSYTWNKSLPNARDAFISGDLAMYIGYASELPLILMKNPNLNFDVTELPQLTGGKGQRRTTIARVYAFAIPKIAKNTQGAGKIINILTSQESSKLMEKFIGLPSPHRRLLAIEPKDPLKTTFRNSAIMATSWQDPNPDKTNLIITKMIESVVSGRKLMSESIARAQRELQVVVKSYGGN